MIPSSKIRIAVLRGGPSSAYDHSLNTGKKVLSLLRELGDKYEPVDIFISKDGEWHLGGLVQKPESTLRHMDVVFNALHGEYGEDGQVQRILEPLHIPYTGSGALASALAMNKELAKRAYEFEMMNTPKHDLLTFETFDDDQIIRIFQTYLHPVIVKPANRSASLGVSIAHTYEDLKQKIKDAFRYSPRVMVEEFIKGKSSSCGVVEGARGEKLYALIPVEVSGGRVGLSNLNIEEKKEVERLAKKAHEALGIRHYSTSDFIITPKGKVYILETNSLPHLYEDTLMHQSLHAVGWEPKDFVDHVIELALKK